MREKLMRVLFLNLLVISAGNVFAAIDVHEFDSEQARERYHQLVDELRCPKCQNQNLLDSNSQIAIDLRGEVARLIKEGKNNTEVKTFMVDRYGDFVLYKPPVQKNTVALWLGPVVMFVIAFGVFVTIVLRRKKLSFDEDEDENLDEIASVLESGIDNESEEKNRK